MKKILAFLIFLCVWACPVRAGELAIIELDIGGVQDNWVSFPKTSWTNNLGYDIAIKSIHMQIVGADQLLGELALWLIPGTTWPPAPNAILASFGVEFYSNPNTAPFKQVYFNDGDQITIRAGQTVSLVTNGGPVNLPNGGKSPALSYVAVCQFYYKKSGT